MLYNTGMSHKNTGRNNFWMILGAALLTSTSAIGPGFLTQTAFFTEKLGSSFSSIILLSTFVVVVAQLNIWLVISVSGMRCQEIANKIFPGMGFFLAALLLFGGIVFDIGNIAGTGLGMEIMFGIDPGLGAGISSLICVLIFFGKEFRKIMDRVVLVLAVMMGILIFYVAFVSGAPGKEIVMGTFHPDHFSFFALVTLVGGTGGGYILFAGAHRLIENGGRGVDRAKQATSSALISSITTAVLRYTLFVVVLGIILKGISLDPTNPAATPFRVVGGELGYQFFGVVLWCASMTSVIGCSFASISFLRTLSGFVDRNNSRLIVLMIILSAALFIGIGRPVDLLIIAGALNGLILPFGLIVILIAAKNPAIVGRDYKHSRWLLALGLIAFFISVCAVVLQFIR
jgi:Mn2+/Fe2+ NRAMP family transporter